MPEVCSISSPFSLEVAEVVKLRDICEQQLPQGTCRWFLKDHTRNQKHWNVFKEPVNRWCLKELAEGCEKRVRKNYAASIVVKDLAVRKIETPQLQKQRCKKSMRCFSLYHGFRQGWGSNKIYRYRAHFLASSSYTGLPIFTSLRITRSLKFCWQGLSLSARMYATMSAATHSISPGWIQSRMC